MAKKTWLFFLSLTVILSFGFGYWWLSQKYLISPFKEKIESIAKDKEQRVSPKDIATLERDSITLQNNLNTSVFQLISGLFFAITASIAWLNLKATEDKQITERFAKAIEQLGSQDLQVRIGAIYSMERLAKDSPRDHWTVMEVLTSFIKSKSFKQESVIIPNLENLQNKSRDTITQSVLQKIQQEQQIKITIDIQAALTVISRRNHNQDPKDKYLDISHCDIRGADLRKAKLNKADLTNTNLSRANLEDAELSEAKLQNSDLTHAWLNKANLKRANLHLAKLNAAQLQEAQLQKTDLTGAEIKSVNLNNAKLNKAILHGAILCRSTLNNTDLTDAKLKRTNLKEAKIDNKTRLDEKWKRVHQINISGAKGKNFDPSCDFSEAVLTNANFDGASLKGANFDGADLGGATFKDANLEKAEFQETDLLPRVDAVNFNGAILIGATFRNVILKGSMFIRADLTGATIELSDAQGANFEEANLSITKFISSIIKQAVFCNSNYKDANFTDTDTSEINVERT